MAVSLRANDVFSGLTMLVAFALLILVILSMTGAVSLCGKRRRDASSYVARRAAQILAAGAAAGCSRSGASCGSAAAALPAAPAGSYMGPPPPAPAPAAAPAAAPEPAPAPAAGGAPAGVILLDMEAPQAVEAVRAANRDKVLYVLGQMSCPACQACKRYLAEKGHGDVAVFVDLASHGGMLKDGSLPRGVAQSLGRGVPCLVAYSHRAGAVMKKVEGFSPKAVDELVGMVRAA